MATYFFICILMLNDIIPLQAIPMNAGVKSSTRETFISSEVTEVSDLITQPDEVKTKAIITETTQTVPAEIQQGLDIDKFGYISSAIEEETTIENILSNEEDNEKSGNKEIKQASDITYRNYPKDFNNDTSDPTSRLFLQNFLPKINDFFLDDIKEVISTFSISNPLKNKREISRSSDKSANSRSGVKNSYSRTYGDSINDLINSYIRDIAIDTPNNNQVLNETTNENKKIVNEQYFINNAIAVEPHKKSNIIISNQTKPESDNLLTIINSGIMEEVNVNITKRERNYIFNNATVESGIHLITKAITEEIANTIGNMITTSFKDIPGFNIFDKKDRKRVVKAIIKSVTKGIVVIINTGTINGLTINLSAPTCEPLFASDAKNINVILNDDKTINNENLGNAENYYEYNIKDASAKNEITDNAVLSSIKLSNEENKNESDIPETTIEDLNDGSISSNEENKNLYSLHENKNIIKRDVELQKIEIPLLGNIKSISDGDNIKTFIEFLKDLVNKAGLKIPRINKEDGTIVNTKF